MKRARFRGPNTQQHFSHGRLVVLMGIGVIPFVVFLAVYNAVNGILLFDGMELSKWQWRFLPTSAQAAHPGWGDRSIAIAVDRRGQLSLGRQPLRLQEVGAIMSNVVSRLGTGGVLVIKADAKAEWRYLEPVLASAAKCGVMDVSFVVRDCDGWPYYRTDRVTIACSRSHLWSVMRAAPRPPPLIAVTETDSPISQMGLAAEIQRVIGVQPADSWIMLSCRANVTVQTLIDVLDAITSSKSRSLTVPWLLVSDDQVRWSMTNNAVQVPARGLPAPDR